MPQSLPATLAMGPVGLVVRELDRSLAFYTRILGLDLLEREAERAALGAGGRVLIELVERRDARRDPAEAGLFHVALRTPDRAGLARILRRLVESGVRLTGASDHVVSEALYLDDPDGHGIELYRDRPREDWYRDGKLAMATLPLDDRGLLAEDGSAAGLPPATDIGHVHLETHDIAAARAFYVDRLGFDVMVAWPQALFLSRGGYHHHLGVNSWQRRSQPAADRPDRLGLLYYTLVLGGEGEARTLRDPSGLELRLVPSQP